MIASTARRVAAKLRGSSLPRSSLNLVSPGGLRALPKDHPGAAAGGSPGELWFTFLEVKGVEPTTNGAERALRTAVQWRKICFGNRSRSGEIATARLLTVTQTCKRQQRHALGYLREAVQCHRRRTASPSLLRRRI